MLNAVGLSALVVNTSVSADTLATPEAVNVAPPVPAEFVAPSSRPGGRVAAGTGDDAGESRLADRDGREDASADMPLSVQPEIDPETSPMLG
jgi:hypothetical protein